MDWINNKIQKNGKQQNILELKSFVKENKHVI